MEILLPTIMLSLLGLIFGLGLALASKKLAVKVDPKLDKIHNLLPGTNCGACGEAGCFGFAEAVFTGKSKIDACRSSSDETKERIAEVLGRKLIKDIKKIAVLHCNGGNRVKNKFVYDGIAECRAVNLTLGGQKECFFGCLGFDTCARICPFNAISMGKDGLPLVDKERCRACNKCVKACPKKLFSLIPQAALVYVACLSHDSGKDTQTACPVGCIACGLCQKACKFDAIHIIDNLAIIDYNKCTSCKACVSVCPRKCILVRSS
ncbi:MAG: RnfABCDGE type electron transport complex subunit B [Candidatus Omnitrophota bacterium]|nr:RnfABCDGE type electron transport complex subunit B [Candidatus Omnitrophota bacterium]